MSDKFFFGIPLRSKASSRNWLRVCELFRSTLSSILNQTNGDFGVIVACHDVPSVANMTDPRVEVLICAAKVPVNLNEQMTDKHLKRRMIAAKLKRLGGGYLMSVDGDDLVSNRIVAFVERDRNPYGYIINRGYEFDCVTKRVLPAPRFNRLCGSSGIFHFEAHHLPDSANDPSETLSDYFRNHTEWSTVANNLGRPLKMLPFRGAMYVTNHGDNHSTQAGNVGWRRTLLRKFFIARAPDRALRQEFALDTFLEDAQ
jgi:hypothetical protein